MSSYTIGQLARLSNVGVETIRFYEREGIMPRPPRRASGYRKYADDAVVRLRFIRHAKELGFALKDIKDLLALRVTSSRTCADVRKRADARLADVRVRLAMLQRMEAALEKLTAACRGRGPTGACPILDALEGNELTP